jgi:phosphoserine aminotransferase
VAADAGEPYNNLPDPATWDIPDNARYLHYTPNETIGGVEFHFVPETGDIPLVADMSSCILSRPIDCSRFGVIYAGAQKNIGPAGLCLVIVRKDLLGRARATTPSLMNWTLARDNDSMLNTPPTYAWYLAGLVYQWLLEQGGLAVMAERNSKKADTLYEFIDSSDFYSNPVVPEVRSRMNVPFTLADDRLDAVFLKSAEEHRLLHLKGHRAVGGMRASIYNAVPQQAVDDLVSFMSDFEQKYG